MDEGIFVRLYCIYAIIAYSHYGISVILTLAEVLNINVLRITPKKKNGAPVATTTASENGETSKKHKKVQ